MQRPDMHQSVSGDVDDFRNRDGRTSPDDDEPTGHDHRLVGRLIEIRPGKASFVLGAGKIRQ